ncbi:hypothetical protein [Xylanimonas ulmi]|uniref:Uncharacterized protein n=1 Tax=Xylanimonas ulmi TaxID=228973 RepID=A0A4Q7M7E2_9MICO|nr:hypothetical protein [Xylanibacterium ulmi]RZS63023.1 hypothetical protein EV386_3380 [Xylanibacterium ulmi]
MAKNIGGRRAGAVTNRVQFETPGGTYVKTDRLGVIISVKKSPGPYRGVAKVSAPPKPAGR